MFKSIDNKPVEMVTIYFEGRALTVRKDLNVASALLESGIINFRESPVGGSSRGPYCMMGVCFDCLINIDGRDNQQSCMVKVSDGMKISRQIINGVD